MDSFASHMFTANVQAEQDKVGMKERFQHTYKNRFIGALDNNAIEFIASRTSFYLATVSETGWPYVQHRGGSAGFLKILDETTIGFADYLGNKQFISKGNLKNNDKVSLILMDYPRQARLKLIGHMSMHTADEKPELVDLLTTKDQGPVERVAVIKLSAMDWNCPKYIEPRYDQNEATALIMPHLSKRDKIISILAKRLEELGEDVDTLINSQEGSASDNPVS